MNTKARFKVLFVTAGTELAPATRYRIYQYLPYLEKEGIEYRIYSIISRNMTHRMIKSPTFNVFQKVFYYVYVVFEKFIRSLNIICLADKFDIVFLQRATFSFGLERILKKRNQNLIFDIDDAIYMPDKEEKTLLGWVKKVVKRKEVIAILKASKIVLVENTHIKSFVEQYCKNINFIIGPIDSIRNHTKEINGNAHEIKIGWIGSPSTTVYLGMLDNVLMELSRKHRFKLVLVGASHFELNGVEVEHLDWKQETEVSELHKFDIGIMPMPDNEWTRGKVGCKMLQYMANAIPAVVSYTPTNAEIIEDGTNGFLASSEKEWVEKLSLLIKDSDVRKKMGIEGRRKVERDFSVEVNAPKYIEIFRKLIRNGKSD